MAKQVRLSDVITSMEMPQEVGASYLNRKTGEVLFGSEDGDYEDGDYENSADVLDQEEDLLPLPTEFDFHEYSVMEKFCHSIENEEVFHGLSLAIKGSGAFGRFKEGIHRYGIAERWYRYRDEALRAEAIDWCEAHDIPYTDDRPNMVSPDDAEMPKHNLYQSLASRLSGLFQGEREWLVNTANFAALVYHGLPKLNWAGFYFFQDEELMLGPFQGKPACTRIALGQGVCGKAAEQCRTLIVDDVHEFPGHIACDDDSNSEMVVPVLKGDVLLGVFDLDSPLRGRFDERDQTGIERMIGILVELTDFNRSKGTSIPHE